MLVGCIDVNFFEGQARQRFDETILGDIPCVVAHPQGRIVSLNIAAKNCGLSRQTHLSDALEFVPHLRKIEIPLKGNGKPDERLLYEASMDFKNCILNVCRSRNWDIPIEFGSRDEIFMNLDMEVDKLLNESDRPFIDCNELHENSFFETPYERIEMDEVIDFGSKRKYLAINYPEIYYSSYIMTHFMREIQYQVGFQVSVGIGHDRFQSKIAVDLNGPDALTYLDSDAFFRVGADLDISQIVGLKHITGDKLKEHFGIEKVWEMRDIPFNGLLRFFNSIGDENPVKKTFEFKQKIHGSLPLNHMDNYLSFYE